MTKSPGHLAAVLQALLVTFLWSTSWVLIKIGLADIPALTFAGLRYMLAFLCLLPFILHPSRRASLRELTGKQWVQLIGLGLVFYAITQGAQFVALAYMPAITISLLLSLTSVVVALLGIVLLAERPTLIQWCGVLINLVGILIYFYPLAIPASQTIGLIAAIAGLVANAFASILGRHINRDRHLPPITVTVVSMGVGAIVLLATGLLTQGFPRLGFAQWAIIAWLAIVNTALAFTLWNHTLRTLPAMESTIINNTMLIQITVLAWLFLGERIGWREGVGLVLAGIGALVVQIRRQNQT
jgi:drug/metabolite transporter (DMT)-like permease